MPALDGVRGLAILAVMVFHFRAPELPRWAAAAPGLGWAGVDLFFVLSGFLITGILLDTRDSPRCLPVFWMRRILRIFPLYFAALALLLALSPTSWLPAEADRRYYWLYLNNWLNLLENRDVSHLLGHFWSLAVEEQFYLLWPLVVWALSPTWTLRLASAGIAGIAAARTDAVLCGIDPEFIYRNTFFRLDALLAGAACACLIRTANPARLVRLARLGIPIAVGGVALTVAAARSTHYNHAWIQILGYPLLWLGFGCFVLSCALAPGRWAWVSAKPLRELGKYSYGLYVWHWPVACALVSIWRSWSLGGWSAAAAMQLCGFAGSAVLAWTSYRVLEAPMLRLKRFFTLEAPDSQPVVRDFFSSSISAGTTSNRSPTIP
jgi:peptidoglycan/LPS O-acetylase OafA/YrhL